MRKIFIIIYVIIIIFSFSACNLGEILPQFESINTTSEENKEIQEESQGEREEVEEEKKPEEASSNEISDYIDQIENNNDGDNLYSEQIEKQNNFIHSPFTGKIINSENFNRAVIASIENSPGARPQSGLNQASIVYELLVEGGITRFLALYWEDIPDKIGPIRSVRPYMIEIAEEYNALLLHSGASPEGFATLQNADVASLDQIHNGNYYWRSSDREIPHNLYTRSRVKDYLDSLTGQGYQSRFNFEQFSFISSNREAEEIEIDYWGDYKVLYRYNLEDNNYRRFIDDFDTPHQDENNTQITCDNIIIQFVNITIKDDEGRLEINTRSEGEAYIFNNGKVIEGSWKNEEDSWTKYYDKDDRRVKLNQGSTWIQVVPISSEVSYSSRDLKEDKSRED